jgi:hypothetical protein
MELRDVFSIGMPSWARAVQLPAGINLPRQAERRISACIGYYFDNMAVIMPFCMHHIQRTDLGRAIYGLSPGGDVQDEFETRDSGRYAANGYLTLQSTRIRRKKSNLQYKYHERKNEKNYQ